MVWGGREVQAPWGESAGDPFTAAQISDWTDQIVSEQAAALGCTPTPRLAPRVAVRNATGFDQGVVRVLSYDDAVTQAGSGSVWVVGYCD